MESKDQSNAEEESESCASSTTATLEYDDATSRGKILLNKHNALRPCCYCQCSFTVIACKCEFQVMSKCVLCGLLGEFRELQLPRRPPRGQRLVKNEFIFYLRISQLSRSVQHANWAQNLLKLNKNTKN